MLTRACCFVLLVWSIGCEGTSSPADGAVDGSLLDGYAPDRVLSLDAPLDAAPSDALTQPDSDAAARDGAAIPDATVDATARVDSSAFDGALTDSGPTSGCEDVTASGVGTVVMASPFPDRNRYDICGYGGGSDAVIRWSPPGRGFFRARTTGTTLHNMLGVTTNCASLPAGSSLINSCLAGSGPGLAALTVHATGAAASMLFVNDARNPGETGTHTLTIEQVTCGAPTATLSTGVAATGMVPRRNDYAASCAGTFWTEATFAWMAPSTGHFIVDSAGSDFAAAVAVFSSCEDPTELACGLGSAEFDATAGQTYFIIAENQTPYDFDAAYSVTVRAAP